ncbi:hypothetical protein [Amycolatopsis tolypomycina]|uniref:hypothetical protein n=1 Tax=Amycolatopsis tolypomycina TaxID=208445 RepID=UPI00115FE5F1|nr:hypothetical protein [Amycolatopsis tolypomycina]
MRTLDAPAGPTTSRRTRPVARRSAPGPAATSSGAPVNCVRTQPSTSPGLGYGIVPCPDRTLGPRGDPRAFARAAAELVVQQGELDQGRLAGVRGHLERALPAEPIGGTTS